MRILCRLHFIWNNKHKLPWSESWHYSAHKFKISK